MRDDSSPNGFKGYCIDLLDEIAKLVKFEYTIQEVEDKKFGNMGMSLLLLWRIFSLAQTKNDCILTQMKMVIGMESFANSLTNKLTLDSDRCLLWPNVKLLSISPFPIMISSESQLWCNYQAHRALYSNSWLCLKPMCGSAFWAHTFLQGDEVKSNIFSLYLSLRNESNSNVIGSFYDCSFC